MMMLGGRRIGSKRLTQITVGIGHCHEKSIVSELSPLYDLLVNIKDDGHD
jgi:hypothetical protein